MTPNASGPAPAGTGSETEEHKTQSKNTSKPGMRQVLRAALAYAANGRAVFPCTPISKRPFTENGFKDATTDPATIHRWWKRWPVAMIGSPTGNGVFVVDVDLPAGPDSLSALEAKHGPLPPTRESLTGSGGRHLFFKGDARNSAGKLGMGLDIRGNGGYVVLPPSIREDGSVYTWTHETPPAPAPEWLIGAISEASIRTAPPAVKPAYRPETAKHGAASKYGQKALADEMATLAGAGEGGRNDALNKASFNLGQLVAGGELDQGQVEVTLLAAAAGVGLSETEARQTISSGISSGMAHPRTAGTARTATANEEEWKKPAPFMGLEIKRPYPLEALPATIREAVVEVVDIVQCPSALAASSALAAVSTVVQGVADVRRATRLQGPSGDYFLVLADSGERKSTVDGYFAETIRGWEAEQMEAIKPHLAEYDATVAAWEAEKAGVVSAIKDAAKKGNETGVLKRSLAELEKRAPIKPTIPRLLYTDATPEALAYCLHQYPIGAVMSAEAGVVFGGHAMGKDSQMRNLALLNSLWSGEQYRPDRRTGKSFILRSARLTIGLAVQPETMRAFLDRSAGLARGIGFLARFLIACPESTQGKRKFKEPPKAWPYLSKFHRRINSLLEIELPRDQHNELSPVLIDLDREAKELWVTFHDDIEDELAPGREMAEARDVASKTADHAARLACMFHVFSNGPSGCITTEHMRAGAQIAAWHLYEARRFMREITVPESLNLASKLNDWLVARTKQTRCMEITTTEIQKYGPGPLRKKSAMEPILEELERMSRIRMDGQTAIINPNLLEVNSWD